MKRALLALAVMVVGVFAIAMPTSASGERRFSASLTGYEEVPAVSTTGNGDLTARIDRAAQRIDWTLSYSDLEGAVQQAHIHLGQPDVNGGIAVFFCTNLGNGPAGTQPCPASPATISGTFTAADVIGPAGQGLAAGDFEELVDAMRAGVTYANVHSTMFPTGEIRCVIE